MIKKLAVVRKHFSTHSSLLLGSYWNHENLSEWTDRATLFLALACLLLAGLLTGCWVSTAKEIITDLHDTSCNKNMLCTRNVKNAHEI